MTKKESKLKTTQETRILKCQLTTDELLQAGQELAEMLDNFRKTQEERESIAKTYKAKEAELEAQITSKQLLVRNKYELRPVPCENIMDYAKLECYVTRTDTDEEVLRRKMTEEEKQSTFPFDGETESK